MVPRDKPQKLEGRKKSRVRPAPTELVDVRVAKALSHTLRVEILAILDQRVASPKEMAEEIGVSVSKLSFHVKELRDYGCIKLERTEPRRGAVEHFYSGNMRPYFNDRDWKTLSRTARQAISSAVLEMIFDDSAAALDAGVFDAREDRHLSRMPLELDERGWCELNDLLNVTLERALDIESKASARMTEERTEGIPSKLAILHFESPPNNASA